MQAPPPQPHKQLHQRIIKECVKLLILALPYAFIQGVQALVKFGAIFAASKLNALHFVGISESLLTVINLVTVGLSVSLFMLVAETEEEKRSKVNPIHLSRAIVVILLWSVICSIFLAFSGPLYFDWVTNVDVARRAQVYCRINILVIWPANLTVVLLLYLQANEYLLFPIAVSGVATLVYFVFLYLFTMTSFGFGVLGIIVSMLIFQLLGLVSCTIFLSVQSYMQKIPFKRYITISTIFNPANFLSHVLFSIASCAVMMTEVLAFEMFVPISAFVGLNALASNIILTQIDALFILIYIAFGASVTVRVASKIARNKTDNVVFIGFVALGLITLIAGFICVLLAIFREPIALLFTSDPKVVTIMNSSMLIVLLFVLLDSIRVTLGGLFSALGMQLVLAILNFVTFFVVALPVSLIFVFAVFKKDEVQSVQSMWLSFSVSILIFIAGSLILLWRTKLNTIAAASHERVQAEYEYQAIDDVSKNEETETNASKQTIHEE